MKIFRSILIVILLLSLNTVYADKNNNKKTIIQNKSSNIEFKNNFPSRIDLSFSLFSPSNYIFEESYPLLFGLSFNYIHHLFNNLCINAGGFFLFQSHESKSETYVFLNSYSLGLRYYLHMFDIIYPYIGFNARITWCGESDGYESRNYFAYGGDPFTGVSIEVRQYLDVFLQYNYILSRVSDDAGTNISGHYFSIGIAYKGNLFK
ncbi:hypothetical protein ACFL20_01920 [Spirochaetota bacterium]